MPISLILSVTDTNRMFTMPMPPTISVMTAITSRIDETTPSTSLNAFWISAEFWAIYTSSLPCFISRYSTIRLPTSRSFSFSTTVTSMDDSISLFGYSCCTVVMGIYIVTGTSSLSMIPSNRFSPLLITPITLSETEVPDGVLSVMSSPVRSRS